MIGETNWTNRSKEVHKYWTSQKEIPEYRKIMKHLVLEELKKKEYSITDCGCGTGLFFEHLPNEYKSLYNGVDFTQEMVDFCKEKYPDYEDSFNRIDLTDVTIDNYELLFNDILITQNVIQHILLFQSALENIFFSANHCIILCERTHQYNTVLAHYEPVYRWRFNIKDMYDILSYYARKYDYLGEVEILSHPKTTFNEENMLTIFRVYRDEEKKVNLDKKPYTDDFIKNQFVYDNLKNISIKDRIINKIKKINR